MKSMDNLPKLPLKIFIKALLTSDNPNLHDFFRGEYLYGFSHGREALLALFKHKKWENIGLPTFTCPVLYQAIIESGAKPVFIDVDPKNFNLSLEKINPKMNLDAIIAVHTFGNLIDMNKLKKKLPVKTRIIEDCAHCLDKQIGGESDYAIYSLYKQIPNFDGAILVSKEEVPIKYSKQKGFEYLRLLLLLKELRPIVNFARRFTSLPEDKFKGIIIKPLSKLSLNLFALQNKLNVASLFDHCELVENRDKKVLSLRMKGIFVDRQWYNAICPEDSVGKHLSERIINYPKN